MGQLYKLKCKENRKKKTDLKEKVKIYIYIYSQNPRRKGQRKASGRNTRSNNG